jgi:hypothetical protein
MIKYLIKHGDSYVLVIDEPIIESLHISPETQFEVFTDGQCLVLVPISDPNEDKEFQNALEMVHKRFGRAMKQVSD